MHSSFELRDEFRHNALIYQRIVLANTHLARIDCLAPQKPLCGKMNVGIFGYDRGISATQLPQYSDHIERILEQCGA